MQLPNGDQAQLGDKLERYVLNMEHFKGRHKATLFCNRLGITLENKAILAACRRNPKVTLHECMQAFQVKG